jgi:hypothetical protein
MAIEIAMDASSTPASDPFDILPSSEDQFRSKQYWDDFFAKRTGAFEWYGEWNDLKAPLVALFETDSSVTMLGCGNSAMSQHMYDHGFHSIMNIDYSEAVIRDMAELNKRRSEMRWAVADARETGLEAGSADVVLDKGTLDAMLPAPTEEAVEDASRMLDESGRILREGGAYVCVSLLQSHVLDLLMGRLGGDWECHVAPFHPEAPSPLCPFMVVAWKRDGSGAAGTADEPAGAIPGSWTFHESTASLRKLGNLPDGAGPSSNTERITGVQRMKDLVMAAAWRYRTRVSLRATKSGQRVSFDLFDSRSASASSASAAGSASSLRASTPRFTLTAVDASSNKTCCALVVPMGREAEWMFASEEGQLELAKQAGMGRLILVRRNRGHEFGSEDDVREEVAAAVMDAAPHGLEGQLAWLGVASEDDVVVVAAELESALSGRMSIEDVPDPDASHASKTGSAEGEAGAPEPGFGYPRLRRLVFFSNQGAVQSEARVVGAGAKSKRRGRKAAAVAGSERLEADLASLPAILQPSVVPPPADAVAAAPVVDFSYLAFEYHQAVVACLALPAAQAAARCAIASAVAGSTGAEAAGTSASSSATMNVCILGLGGGGLAMFLHRAFGAGSGVAVGEQVTKQTTEALTGATAAPALPPVDAAANYGVLPLARVVAAAVSAVSPSSAPAAGAEATDSATDSATDVFREAPRLQLVPPPLRLHAIELDPQVAAAARDYFGFTQRDDDGRCVLTIGDGLEHVVERAKACEAVTLEATRDRLLLDALIIDVDAKDLSSGLSFPPKVRTSGKLTTTDCEVFAML